MPLLADHPAYVIYTSGSTGEPKGVVVSHRALGSRLRFAQEKELREGDSFVQKTTISFDASIVEVFGPLLVGGTTVLARPGGERDPGYLISLLSDWEIPQATFTMAMLAALLKEHSLASCRSLRTVLAGGEVMPGDLPALFYSRSGAELYNRYGPTEATISVTSWRCLPGDPGRSQPIGRPIARTRIYLLDDELRPVPLGVAGELCIAGACLARGYLGRPGPTAEKFVPQPFAGGEAGARIYRTGDLARFRADGAIEFVGRIDGQVKIRGFRVELGEIEAALHEHPAVESAAVVDRREAATGSQRLLAYLVLRPGAAAGRAAIPEIRELLKQKLPAYMMPAAFTVLPAFPLSPTGKVDKKALPEPAELAEGSAWEAPQGPLEKLLAAIWSGLLGGRQVGREDSFFDLGGHSLLATQVASRVRDALGIELPMRYLFEAPTPKAFAAVIEALRPEGYRPMASPIERVPRDRELPLSFAQERLWFLDQLDPGRATYNMPGAVRLLGRLSLPALGAALAAVVERHEALRTTFRAGADHPVQVLGPATAARLPLSLVDLAGLPAADREAAALRLGADEAAFPFDLATGPLARACLLRLAASGEEHALLLTLHHIVSDGWSLGIFVRELAAFYSAALAGRPAELPPLPVQYADFAVWQRGWLAGAELERQLAWWREHLAGAPAVLDLPADRPRPAVQSDRGGAVPFNLPGGLFESLIALGRGREPQATLFMTLLAGFSALLGRLAGSTDLVVGSPVANRQRVEIEGLIGFFVNTLALRTDLSGEPGFAALVGRVREVTLSAYTHQDVPFEKLVEELAPQRSLGHSPLFQVVLVLQNAPTAPLALPGLTLEPLPAAPGAAKFDLTLTLTPGILGNSGAVGTLEYNRDLFDRTSAQRLAGSFLRLLEAATAAPEVALGDLPLLTATEHHQLLREWNSAPGEAGWGKRYPVCSRRGRRPRRGRRRSSGAASSSPTAGFRRGPASSPRGCGSSACGRGAGWGSASNARRISSWASSPPSRPGERTSFSIPRTRRSACPSCWRTPRPPWCSPGATSGLACRQRERRCSAWTGRRSCPSRRTTIGGWTGSLEDLLYVIYTSGSTGVPKGAGVFQRGFVNLLRWYVEEFGISAEDRFLVVTSAGFDLTQKNFFAPLLSGGLLILADPAPYDPREILATLERHRITRLNCTPSAFYPLLEEGGLERLSSLRSVFLGGEPIAPARLASWRRSVGRHTEVVNTYGPTECTDVVAFHRLAPEGETVPGSSPVGRALPGFRLLVLDRNLAPLPLGVAGELTVGGVGVGAGYLGRPALTAEKFVPDPFAAEPGSRLYFTGDLARTLPGGEIDFLGRVDQQVKIRGFRIELGEVEAALAACPGVGGAAVLVREDRPGERRLVAYVERTSGGPGVASTELRAALGELLPEYMVPGELVVLERLPLSANGKIDRRALAELAPEATAEADGYVAPRTPAEEVMAGIWATVLGRERVGIADNFFALGGHSLLATRVVSRLREAFGVEIPLRALFASPTVAALAEVVERGWRVQAPPLQRLHHAGPVPLSFAQERLWFLDQLAPGSAAYNLAAVLRLSGPLARPALSASLEAIVARHAALRTTFETVAGRPVQAIAPAGALPLPLTSVESLPEALREEVARRLAGAAAARPFDLARGPLVRALLLRLSGTSHLLVLALHHIVTDGWSMEVLTRELGELYGALVEGRVPALPELPIQYSDYAVWQRLWLSGAVLAEQIAWWRERLAGAPSVLDLPGDRPRPAVPSLRGDTIPVVLPAALDLRLTGIARDASATLFMALLAAYAALLNRFTGSDDLVVGSPVANRQQVATEGLIGFFVNTLPLRVGLGGRPTFAALLAAVREDTLGAYAHQDVPFEMLVEALAPARSLAHSPLFQVVLALQNAAPPVLDLAGLRLELLPAGGSTAKFDLTLALVPGTSGLAGLFEYSRDLFDRTTAMRLAESFHRLLAGIVSAPEMPVADLPLLSPAELQQLREWRGVATDYPRRSTIPALFAEQAARAPDAVALVAGIAGIGGLASGAVSYGELLSRARLLAARLRALGVGPEVPVGLLLERSLGMVVATLAVLEAEGAYVPLDPGAPAERLSWLLGETGVPVLIVEESRLGGLPEPFASFPAQVLSIGADGRSRRTAGGTARQGRSRALGRGGEPRLPDVHLGLDGGTQGGGGRPPRGRAAGSRDELRAVRPGGGLPAARAGRFRRGDPGDLGRALERRAPGAARPRGSHPGRAGGDRLAVWGDDALADRRALPRDGGGEPGGPAAGPAAPRRRRRAVPRAGREGDRGPPGDASDQRLRPDGGDDLHQLRGGRTGIPGGAGVDRPADRQHRGPGGGRGGPAGADRGGGGAPRRRRRSGARLLAAAGPHRGALPAEPVRQSGRRAGVPDRGPGPLASPAGGWSSWGVSIGRSRSAVSASSRARWRRCSGPTRRSPRWPSWCARTGPATSGWSPIWWGPRGRTSAGISRTACRSTWCPRRSSISLFCRSPPTASWIARRSRSRRARSVGARRPRRAPRPKS